MKDSKWGTAEKDAWHYHENKTTLVRIGWMALAQRERLRAEHQLLYLFVLRPIKHGGVSRN
jgi:hypothetical protein